MKIEFDYDYGPDHILKTTTSNGLPLEILFDGFDASWLYISGIEFEVASDDYKGLYVDFNGIIPMATVIQQANAQIEAIVAEIEQEARELERHARSFSVPR